MAAILSSEARTPGRRSALEVMMDVLKVASSGNAKPTHIMYKSNTSWGVLQKYLESLLASGLIQQHSEGARLEYRITDRGMAVLENYLKLLDRARPYQMEACV